MHSFKKCPALIYTPELFCVTPSILSCPRPVKERQTGYEVGTKMKNMNMSCMSAQFDVLLKCLGRKTEGSRSSFDCQGDKNDSSIKAFLL